MKKALKNLGLGCLAIMLVPVCGIIIFIIIGVTAHFVNNAALPGFREEVISNFTLPENTELVEYVSDCGNSSGTGDHTDLYVAILIKSSLGEDAIKEYYKGDEHYWRTWNTKRLNTTLTFGMDCMNLKFDTDISEAEGYYILEYNKSAPLSWFDMRGM